MNTIPTHAATTNPATPPTRPLRLYGEAFDTRLLLGTAGYPSMAVLEAALRGARPAMVTAGLRRQNGPQGGGADFWQFLQDLRIPLLPNTAGCHSLDEAVTMAQMAREMFGTPWIKLELIGDDYTLQPDMTALAEACRLLARDGFKVMPYCTEDLVGCRRLLDAGCEVLMPWAAPIGSGRGPVNPYGLRQLRERLPDVPMIVDAGLGLPSHACQVMEWGFDAVLLNTAVSRAADPVAMARAFAQATEAGRHAFEGGPMAPADSARPSTPVVGMPFWHSDPGRSL